MSIYELLNYDELLRRMGIHPGEVWHCGDNPGPNTGYDAGGQTYDGTTTYVGNNNRVSGGLCLSDDINVNGLLLNHRDHNGTVWVCTGIENWWTMPPSEIPDVPKPYWDGSLLTTGRYNARSITVTGTFLPPDKSLVWYNRDALIRVASLVRGAGLILLCGNESPSNTRMLDGTDDQGNKYQYLNSFYDPPKMAIIQSSDVPLMDTVNAQGRTDFSLSFTCVQPTKISLYEQVVTLPVEDAGVLRRRYYKAFSYPSPPDADTTEYTELVDMRPSTRSRTYAEVLKVNLDSLIPDEEMTEGANYDKTAYESTGAVASAAVYNAGNYFAFPIFVFGSIAGADSNHTVTVQNITTGESMTIQASVTDGHQLIIDTGMRRVARVNVGSSTAAWTWNERSWLSLTSQWISLAPGGNTIVTSRATSVQLGQLPQIYWRDTWIG